MYLRAFTQLLPAGYRLWLEWAICATARSTSPKPPPSTTLLRRVLVRLFLSANRWRRVVQVIVPLAFRFDQTLAGKPRAATRSWSSPTVSIISVVPAPVNSYVDTLIDDAQKAGVLIHAIYCRTAWATTRGVIGACMGTEFPFPSCRRNWRRSLFPRYETAVSFSPYLSDLMRRLNNQYLLLFVPKPMKKGGFAKR